MDQFDKEEPEENKPLPSFFDWLENQIPDDDENDYNEEAFEAESLKFAEKYLHKVISITLDYYPQFRAKETELKEKLIEDGKDTYLLMSEMEEYYLDGKTDTEINKSPSSDICINSIDYYIRNSALDHMLENYDAWFKKKISYENIYVESFYAGVYAKQIQNTLIRLLYEFFPAMICLPPEQENEVQATLILDAWSAYFTLTLIDPDELNDSTIIYNLEDYEFESLLLWPGPEVIKNKNGKVQCLTILRNEPTPDKVPALCTQCKRFYDFEDLNKLCSVNRFDQRDTKDFKCRAYEKK